MFSVALKILLYDKTRSFFTLLGIVFAVSLIFSQLGIFLGLMQTSSVIIDNTRGDIWFCSKNSKNFDFSQPFPEYIYYQILSEPAIVDADRLIVAWGVIRQKLGGTEQVEIVGFDPDSGVGGPWGMLAGDTRKLKNGPFFIVDESAQKRLGAIEIGEYRDILSRRLQLVGISTGVKSFTTAPVVFTSFHLARQLVAYVGSGDSTVFVVAQVAPGADVTEVVSGLRARYPLVDVYSKAEYSMKTRLYWMIETGVGFSFLLTIGICFLIGMLIVGQTIYNSTQEHIKEYGTLKALGATNFEISRIILSQALLNALAGYAVCFLLTLLSQPVYAAIDMILVINWQMAIAVFMLTLVMCFGASFISVRKVKKIDPAILFRG